MPLYGKVSTLKLKNAGRIEEAHGCLGVQSPHVGSLTSLQLGDMLYAHCSHDVLQGLGAAVQAKKLFNEVSQMAWEGRASARCGAVVLVNAQMLCEYAWTCLDFTEFSASL